MLKVSPVEVEAKLKPPQQLFCHNKCVIVLKFSVHFVFEVTLTACLKCTVTIELEERLVWRSTATRDECGRVTAHSLDHPAHQWSPPPPPS